jgi:hypothetical protein
MKKIALLTLQMLLLTAAVAQIEKAKKYLELKSWAKAQGMAAKAVEKDKNAAEWWYIKASAEYEMSQMDKYRGGKVNYLKECTKSAIRARQKDEPGKYLSEYEVWMKGITIQNNKEAMAAFAKSSYARSIQMYRNSYLLTGDTIAYGMLGLSYIKDKQDREGIKIMKSVANWNFDAWSAGNCPGSYVREAFEELSNYYIAKGNADSAREYTEMGLQVFPLNLLLKKNARLLLANEIDNKAELGYNADYIEAVNRALGYFPADTQFLYAQNFYFLRRIGNLSSAKPWTEATATVSEFYKLKSRAVAAGAVNPTDQFLIRDSAAFLFKLLDYFLRRNNSATIAFCFRQWYPVQMKLATMDEGVYENLLKSPPENISRKLISILFNDAREDFPKNKKIIQYRLDYFNRWTSKPVRRAELYLQQEMCDQLVADFPADKKLKTTLQQLLWNCTDSAIAEGTMYSAWKHFNRLSDEYPSTAKLNDLHLRLAKADFKNRYFETRIGYSTSKGVKTPNTGWDGNSKTCDPGSLPDSTLYKVLDRVNYFRQNAGIKAAMVLNIEQTEKAQAAATMFAPKGIFTREPKPETHACYTREAAEAALHSQAILEPNPAQCVTIFIDDKKSDEMINRRAILNPAGRQMGVGCAENNSVFWLLDLRPNPDSTYYKSHFVAWPGKFCSKMLVMDKWTFSLDADLKDATVGITDETGAKVDATVTLQAAPQLKLQTLVIKPAQDLGTKTAGTTWKVKVTLKNKKVYDYQVTTF